MQTGKDRFHRKDGALVGPVVLKSQAVFTLEMTDLRLL